MKVLRFIPFFTPAFGGPHNHVVSLRAELGGLGVRDLVYTTDLANSRGDRLEECPPGVRVFPVRARFRDYLYSPAMAQAALREDFDLIHVHGWRNYQGDLGAWVAARRRVPLVVTTHGTLPSLNPLDAVPKGLHDRLGGRRALGRASGVVAVNRAEVDHCRAHGVPATRIHVIPHGIDLRGFRPGLDASAFLQRFRLDGQRIVLYAGRLHRRKGIHHLLRAFRDLAPAHRDAVLVLAGPDYGFRDALKGLVRRLGLESRVIFTGLLDRRELAQAYNAARVVAYPAALEIHGHALAEASACGRPTVAVAWGGALELVEDGRSGFLIPRYGDVESLKGALKVLLEDEALARTMGQAARSRAEAWGGWDACASRHMRLYRDLLGGSDGLR